MLVEMQEFLRNFLSPITDEERNEVYEEISTGAKPTKDFFIMLVLSVIIATLGLLINSSAIIIGAMLVSPLLTPVLGISLGAIRGDLRLFEKSVEAEGKGILLAIGITILITLVLPTTGITSEILARTKPTPLDLVVALASGAVGAYALCRKNISTTLPGVAIAVAVMPPLSVVGIGVALKMPNIAVGGALLFAANIIAINLAASFIFWIMGFSHRWSVVAEKETLKKLRTSIVLLLIILVPLAWIMLESLNEANTLTSIENILNSQIAGIEHSRLVEYGFERQQNGVVRVYATIDCSREITRERADEIRIALEKSLKIPVDLDLEINQVESIQISHQS